jgi:Cdc6-like AAA superfamily ATPase
VGDKKSAQSRESLLTPLMRRARNIGMKRKAAKIFLRAFTLAHSTETVAEECRLVDSDKMSAAELLSEFKSLRPAERQQLLSALIANKRLRHELEDTLTIERRRKGPSRPLERVLSELGV